MRTLTVKKNDAGKRIDKFLSKALVNLPQSLLHKYFRKKCVKINGAKANPEDILEENDVITLYISDEFFPDTSPVQKSDDKPFMLPSATLSKDEIVYQDDNIMIIDKPAGELVHSSLPDEKVKSGEMCLVDRFIGYLYKTGQYAPKNEQSFVPSLCNRLDRNTSGLVIAAKNAESLRIMNQKVKMREMIKLYHTVVYGKPPKNEDTLKDFLYKDRNQNRVFIFSSREAAKKAVGTKYDDDIKTVITKYRVLKSDGQKSLLEVELITGRTHQIRAHLSYIGCPIAGDGKYGVNHAKSSGIKYQMLCSHSLQFRFTSDSGILDYLNGKKFTSRHDFTL